MTNGNPQELGLFAKLVLTLAALLLVTGVLWHGITLGVLHRIWNNLINRPDEPMAFASSYTVMALIAAIHDGRMRARGPPVFLDSSVQPAKACRSIAGRAERDCKNHPARPHSRT